MPVTSIRLGAVLSRVTLVVSGAAALPARRSTTPNCTFSTPSPAAAVSNVATT
jgi:hypothetical protein